MKLIILTVIACWSLNCFIGSHRDACKYNLHESISSSYCKFIGTATASTNPNMDANTLQKRDQILTFELLNCYQYYEKLKECNKEEYKYMPAIYGMNVNPNPISTSALERIASGK
ncbi:hypothetical protein [Leptospira santarosai]|nr:hypothetical protein [Leptospira santarosai]